MDNKKCEAKYDIYEIDEDFLRHLKKIDENVLDVTECKIYCGPVLTVNNMNFFVPVIPEQKSENEECILKDFINGKFAFLDFNRMIPCLDKFLTEVDGKQSYKDFCIISRQIIENLAKEMFEKRKKK